MGRRTITSILLLLIGLPAILLGGIPFFVLISIFLCGAAWEFSRMFAAQSYQPSLPMTVLGTLIIILVRSFRPQLAAPTLSLVILLAMTIHLIAYERGRDQAGTDFAITVAGIIYFGWIGAYLIDLRFLPNGGWWLMLALPIVWLTDTGAYAIGAAYGKHKMAPRLSPKKSWEGYWAGVFTGVLGGAFLVWAYSTFGGLKGDINILQGFVLGIILSMLTILGDLGESLIKRQAGMKDSSNVFPGHGGFFDRIDSWLWAGVLSYYFIVWFLNVR
jgi:phosphatidate cytidylyltransferase